MTTLYHFIFILASVIHRLYTQNNDFIFVISNKILLRGIYYMLLLVTVAHLKQLNTIFSTENSTFMHEMSPSILYPLHYIRS